MAWTREQIERAWRRTDGHCHLKGCKIPLGGFGPIWEMEHSKPRARGGSDHGNNLFAACVSCNREKQALGSRAFRARHGLRRSPYSRQEKKTQRLNNAIEHALMFGGTALAFVAPPVAVGIGALAALHGASKPVRTPRIKRTKKR